MTRPGPQTIERVQSYVDDLKARMELADWRIQVTPDPPEHDDALAQIIPTDCRRIAHIRVCHDFGAMPVRAQRQALVHELLHLHVEPIWQTGLEALVEALDDQAFRVFRGALRVLVEGAVDAISFPFAEGLPLPEGGTDGPQGVPIEQAEGRSPSQPAQGARSATA